MFENLCSLESTQNNCHLRVVFMELGRWGVGRMGALGGGRMGSWEDGELGGWVGGRMGSWDDG